MIGANAVAVMTSHRRGEESDSRRIASPAAFHADEPTMSSAAPSTLRTFGSLAGPGMYLGAQAGGPLVGRLVANTDFLRALFRYGSFETYRFFVGENADVAALEALVIGQGWLPRERIRIDNVLRLPTALERGEIDVLHHSSHVDAFNDLVALRDRHATRVVPVTGQIHSLSYPRMMAHYALSSIHPPDRCDGIFCSSASGREVVVRSFASVRDQLKARGVDTPPLECALPVVPLGVDIDALKSGDRKGARAALGLAEDAVLLLVLGRFSEYDKMDLFPLLHVFQRLRARSARPLHLVLAGARQGTKTPEMLQIWSKVLGVAESVHVRVDITVQDKHALLAAADVFVSPSDNVQETFGLTVVEAMAAGLPVVVSDFDGYRDTVPDGTGVRIATRWSCNPARLSEYGSLLYERPLHLLLGQAVEIDLRALEERLLELCGDETLRRGLGQRAAQHARSTFDWSRVIPQYEAVWRELQTHARSRVAGSIAPFGMDHRAIFDHYLSAPFDATRSVRRTDFARELAAAGVQHPIYPELKHLFDAPDVGAALELAENPITLAKLRQALLARRATLAKTSSSDSKRDVEHQLAVDFLIGWLLKHALIG